MDSRISIKKKDKVIVDGRWVESFVDYYNCWCTPMELYGKELYEAQNIKYENVLAFKVRYCNKIKTMRTTDKNKFIVIYDGVEYQVYQVDFKSNSKDYVYIKAKMVI
ncbi:phage head closure protein [Clostridium disporicum]|uniref:phage head closure protein n=1 Tax=Clostridium disporicum TaxID=84024 RepID=UPI0008233B63|nr:phage head closure protein [uncultured Clostridium sp.]SCJ09595.1 Bacteriophage head-tail adaptor [uncultured Clostridium sp.]